MSSKKQTYILNSNNSKYQRNYTGIFKNNHKLHNRNKFSTQNSTKMSDTDFSNSRVRG